MENSIKNVHISLNTFLMVMMLLIDDDIDEDVEDDEDDDNVGICEHVQEAHRSVPEGKFFIPKLSRTASMA